MSNTFEIPSAINFRQVSGACYSWSGSNPSSWNREPSLTTRRAFAYLLESHGEVLAMGGLDGTLSPLAFRQVGTWVLQVSPFSLNYE